MHQLARLQLDDCETALLATLCLLNSAAVGECESIQDTIVDLLTQYSIVSSIFRLSFVTRLYNDVVGI